MRATFLRSSASPRAARPTSHGASSRGWSPSSWWPLSRICSASPRRSFQLTRRLRRRLPLLRCKRRRGAGATGTSDASAERNGHRLHSVAGPRALGGCHAQHGRGRARRRVGEACGSAGWCGGATPSGVAVAIRQRTNICIGRPCADPSLVPSLFGSDDCFKSSKVYRQSFKQGVDFVNFNEAVIEIKAQYARFKELVGAEPDYFEAMRLQAEI